MIYCTKQTYKGAIIAKTKKRMLTPENIINLVAYKTGVTYEQMQSKSRLREFVLPRHFAMLFIKNNTDLKLKQIGQLFNRDHSTVICAIDSLKGLIKFNKEIKEKYYTILDSI